MAVNKVVINTEKGAETLIDLTNDLVTPETLAKGVTAHNARGEVVEGTAKLAKPTQFTNLYDPANVTLNTRLDASASAGVSYNSDKYCNCIKIPFHHIAGEPVVMRIRGIGTVRDKYASVAYAEDGTTKVNHYSFASSNATQFTMSYDEHGDITIAFIGSIKNAEWYYFVFNFQYIGTNSSATTAVTGPIITINEPIGNGGYVE